MQQSRRNHAPGLLLTLHHEGFLLRHHYWALVAEVWSMCEFPTASVDPDDWRDLFRWAGYTRVGDEGLGKRWPRRRKSIRLYRGAHAGLARGWSWTTDLETARWFAARDLGQGAGDVWTTVVEPRHLLAQIDARKESEYVIDPETLGDIEMWNEEVAA